MLNDKNIAGNHDFVGGRVCAAIALSLSMEPPV
jgi:hypothetical protein